MVKNDLGTKDILIYGGIGFLIYKLFFSSSTSDKGGASVFDNFGGGFNDLIGATRNLFQSTSEVFKSVTDLGKGVAEGISDDLTTAAGGIKTIAKVAPHVSGIEPMLSVRSIENPLVKGNVVDFHAGTSILGIGGFDFFGPLIRKIKGKDNIGQITTTPFQNSNLKTAINNPPTITTNKAITQKTTSSGGGGGRSYLDRISKVSGLSKLQLMTGQSRVF